MGESNLAVSVPPAAEVRTRYYTVGTGEGFKRQEKSAQRFPGTRRQRFSSRRRRLGCPRRRCYAETVDPYKFQGHGSKHGNTCVSPKAGRRMIFVFPVPGSLKRERNRCARRAATQDRPTRSAASTMLDESEAIALAARPSEGSSKIFRTPRCFSSIPSYQHLPLSLRPAAGLLLF